jgi:hemoglobin
MNRIPTAPRHRIRRPRRLTLAVAGTLLALAALLIALLSAFPARATAPADDRLYRAWGGEAGIRAVMQDFVPRLKAHPRIGHFFKDSNGAQLEKQLTAQLCEVSGGPCRYEGASMSDAHADMGVSRADFNALVEVLQQSMDARGIAFRDQTAMLARLAPMHRDIVE